jgi:hypothetical protein
MKRIGPHSRPGKLAVIDGRSAEARRMKVIRADLTAHVGDNVSTTQKMLIGRIAMLMLRMELMDRKALKHGDLTEKDAREYLGWNNAVARMLKTLGLAGAPAKQRTLQDHLAERAA